MTRGRQGVAIAEMLVAVALAALLSAAAVAALVAAERHVRRAVAEHRDRRVLRESESVLSAELRAASADSIRLRGDTAVEFLGLVGTSVACVLADSVLVLPPSSAASALPYSLWRVPPEAGDLVVAFDTSVGGRWSAAVIDSVSSRADGAGCTPSSGLLSAADSAARLPAMRLLLRTPLSPRPAVGAPVHVARRARYVLLRGADGQWSLSYRRCAIDGVCAASQPVVGPLASAADSGLTVALGAPNSSVDATLRAPVRAAGLPRATRRLLVPLRNRATINP
jgi:hypothetical protein